MLFSQYKTNRLAELMSEQWGPERIPGLLELISVVRPKRVLEIGCFRGVSTEVWLLHSASVVAVDPWPDDAVYRDFRGRCAHYPHLTHVRGCSPSALSSLPDTLDLFDMCYIDGDHSYEAVTQDIVACLKLVSPHGFIAGHDYGGPGTPDVARAVSDCFSDKIQQFSDSSWVAHVKDAKR